MNSYFSSSTGAVAGLPLSSLLHSIVDRVLPVALSHHTRIVNDVKKEILLGTGAVELERVLNELLLAVIRNSNEGDIHISADYFRDMVLIHIDEKNNYNGYALSFSVGSLAPDAARLGGHISMEGARSREAHISFTFPGQFAA